MSSRRRDGRVPRIGLVLGAGGVVGHAFHAGVLAAVAEATGWDPREADVIVGTSAGSVVGALLRAGASAPDLVAARRRRAPSRARDGGSSRADAGSGHLPPIPSRPERRRARDVGAGRARTRRAAAVERAARCARGGVAARRPRSDRARRGGLASAVHRLARRTVVDQRGRARHRPARHLRSRPRRTRSTSPTRSRRRARSPRSSRPW